MLRNIALTKVLYINIKAKQVQHLRFLWLSGIAPTKVVSKDMLGRKAAAHGFNNSWIFVFRASVFLHFGIFGYSKI